MLKSYVALLVSMMKRMIAQTEIARAVSKIPGSQIERKRKKYGIRTIKWRMTKKI